MQPINVALDKKQCISSTQIYNYCTGNVWMNIVHIPSIMLVTIQRIK